ncbi:hypothetical protein I79_021705 [Cricetulus griseus]|uniref:Uncharacterized protein n=1 Tax=Cricetulus griseus TaxID=10029 RepID=G3IDC9_CRIGR|nr:hypothetical protein I79_021705 [Cricetulus griseus]
MQRWTTQASTSDVLGNQPTEHRGQPERLVLRRIRASMEPEITSLQRNRCHRRGHFN